MDNFPDIDQVIIDNFLATLSHVPMPVNFYNKIVNLINCSVQRLGKTITADMLYTEEFINPEDIDKFLEDEEFIDVDDSDWTPFELSIDENNEEI